MVAIALLCFIAAATALPYNVARSSLSSTYNITMVNSCPGTVWPAGWQTDTSRGKLSTEYMGSTLASGDSWTIEVPNNALGLQFWARQECTGSSGSDDFSCEIGDCGGYQCTELNYHGGVIQAELGAGLGTSIYNTDITSYDLSAIGGNNVGMRIVPSITTCETRLCPVSGCAADQAWSSAGQSGIGSPADTTCSDKADFTIYFCPA